MLRLYFNLFHNTDILNHKSSIDLSGRSILEEFVLHNAPTAGKYGKILSSRLSNTGELYFNIKCSVIEHESLNINIPLLIMIKLITLNSLAAYPLKVTS